MVVVVFGPSLRKTGGQYNCEEPIFAKWGKETILSCLRSVPEACTIVTDITAK